jgi:DNA replication protein DnaC
MNITTNLSWQELSAAERNDLAHHRIYDRILEVCQPVYFGGKNMRQDNAGKKRAEIVETFRAEHG